MEQYCNKLAIQILKSDWRPEYIVGISRGGLTLAVMLSHILEVPMYTLKVTLRDGVEEDCDHNCWMAEDAFGHEIYDPMSSGSGKKNILIVDDINDQGTTINWILKDWQSSCFPDDERWQDEIWNHNVRFAVLFDNLASKAEIKVDYVGEEINKAENDVWIDFPFEDWWMK
jgi:hypoxanthine phosphoribosyltransferase